MKTKTTEVPAIIDEAKAAECENAEQINGYLAGEVSRLREEVERLDGLLCQTCGCVRFTRPNF